MVKTKFCTSTSPNSDVMVEVIFIIPTFGFKKTLSNVIKEEFPFVSKLLSPGLTAFILTPPLDKFSISKTFPRESEIVAVFVVKELTKRSVVYVPRPLVNDAEPILSPIINEEIVKDPASETNNAFAISVSPAS